MELCVSALLFYQSCLIITAGSCAVLDRHCWHRYVIGSKRGRCWTFSGHLLCALSGVLSSALKETQARSESNPRTTLERGLYSCLLTPCFCLMSQADKHEEIRLFPLHCISTNIKNGVFTVTQNPLNLKKGQHSSNIKCAVNGLHCYGKNFSVQNNVLMVLS